MYLDVRRADLAHDASDEALRIELNRYSLKRGAYSAAAAQPDDVRFLEERSV